MNMYTLTELSWMEATEARKHIMKWYAERVRVWSWLRTSSSTCALRGLDVVF